MIKRTRTVEIEGGENVTIAALTVAQTRQLLEKFAHKEADNAEWPKQVICWSLNNVSKGNADAQEWTLDRVDDDMDSITIKELWSAIFDLTGLKTVKPGEATAAEKTENSPSSAA